MLTFFILLFIAICIVLGILIYRYDLMKAYYKYQTNELSKLEEKFDKREKMAKDRIDELQNTAYINATTNIWNIDYFITKSNQAFKASYDREPTFTLVAFNICNIGKINQLFGPTEGDRVVYTTAQTLKSIAGRQIYAQIYSNLFCILFTNHDDSYVTEMINKIYTKLINHNENVPIKTAYGIYKITNTSESIMDMINYASLAQKFVNESDEVCYKFFTNELNKTFLDNKRMSEEMEQALEDHKFMVYLQPMYDLHSSKIVSAES